MDHVMAETQVHISLTIDIEINVQTVGGTLRKHNYNLVLSSYATYERKILVHLFS